MFDCSVIIIVLSFHASLFVTFFSTTLPLHYLLQGTHSSKRASRSLYLLREKLIIQQNGKSIWVMQRHGQRLI